MTSLFFGFIFEISTCLLASFSSVFRTRFPPCWHPTLRGCQAGRADRTHNMVVCPLCEEWYHYECVGIPEESLKHYVEHVWACHSCHSQNGVYHPQEWYKLYSSTDCRKGCGGRGCKKCVPSEYPAREFFRQVITDKHNVPLPRNEADLSKVVNFYRTKVWQPTEGWQDVPVNAAVPEEPANKRTRRQN